MSKLVEKSVYILRETKAQFKNPAVLWSTGKDSTLTLELIRRAFYGTVPFPVVHLDTTYKFPEMYEFRDKLAKDWNLDMIIETNEEAIEAGMSKETHPPIECCTALKTGALKQVIDKYDFDALIVSIRWDEHAMRNIERYFSPRDKDGKWHFVREKTEEEAKEGDSPFVSLQQPELWSLYQNDFGDDCSHVRVHPILDWTEREVWQYIKHKDIPTNPLYFSQNGVRYRSLGCVPCTEPVESTASTVDEIIAELKDTKSEERDGRTQDKEDKEIFRRLRSLGYM